MKRFKAFILVGSLLLCTSTGASAATQLVRMTDKTPVDVGRLVDETRRSDVVFIGDTHDDSKLHGEQMEIIKALYARNPQLAIGLEMFTSDGQRDLDDWTNGKLEEKEFVAIYETNWSYDWRLYRDLFVFARDNHIPMIALNVPKRIVSKVVQQGGKALSESERKDLPGAPWTLNPRQANYLRLIREQAFRNAPVRLPVANFEEAQALRNDAIAYNIAKFREKSPRRKVVVISGTWHAIKNGAPESLKKYGNVSSKVVLPDLVEFSWLNPTAEDVDYLIPRGN